jgi:phytoene/squalene synthetase
LKIKTRPSEFENYQIAKLPNYKTFLSASNQIWSHLPAEYAIPARAPSLPESYSYCERLARTHYENFSVATWFLPKRLRQHFFNVYAYCRISDDLSDETGDPAAFRQDQTITRYETFEDLLGYCRYSANPVGHLVLCLSGYRDAKRQQLSDFTCTALQLANFWQDITLDYEKGRIYLPLEDLRKYKVAEADIANRRNSPQFREMMRFEVSRAREWFKRGLPLVDEVSRELAIDIELFTRGGQEILNAIERQDYATLGRRPAISKMRKLALVVSAALHKIL